MPKFRSMWAGTSASPTHLTENPEKLTTPIGVFLRRASIDELPQLFSIFKGEMSFVGPRPALFSQEDLISLRVKNGVDQLVPGLTGWAQVNGRDELTIQKKVEYEIEYSENRSFWFDIKILCLTAFKITRQSEISH